MNSKIKEVKDKVEKGDDAGAKLSSDDMSEVVDTVSSRWLGSIDKEEPEIVDDFLHEMRDAVDEIHATEGYPKGKILKPEEDWLATLVKNNKKM